MKPKGLLAYQDNLTPKEARHCPPAAGAPSPLEHAARKPKHLPWFKNVRLPTPVETAQWLCQRGPGGVLSCFASVSGQLFVCACSPCHCPREGLPVLEPSGLLSATLQARALLSGDLVSPFHFRRTSCRIYWHTLGGGGEGPLPSFNASDLLVSSRTRVLLTNQTLIGQGRNISQGDIALSMTPSHLFINWRKKVW